MGVFYDRVCQAVVAASMKRAVLMLHDGASLGDRDRRAGVAGRCGRDAYRADRAGGGSGGRGRGERPQRFAEYVRRVSPGAAESAYLTCVPISATRRWLGVIFADREGEDFPLEDGERRAMMTLGRLAALTASVEHSTEQRERVELTRDLHENAIQRLFGVALALGSEDDLTRRSGSAARRSCARSSPTCAAP